MIEKREENGTFPDISLAIVKLMPSHAGAKRETEARSRSTASYLMCMYGAAGMEMRAGARKQGGPNLREQYRHAEPGYPHVTYQAAHSDSHARPSTRDTVGTAPRDYPLTSSSQQDALCFHEWHVTAGTLGLASDYQRSPRRTWALVWLHLLPFPCPS